MAGDWIKIEHSLPTKPEVMLMAHRLGIDELTMVGHLVMFWTWVDRNMSLENRDIFGTFVSLDRIAGRDGFCTAMVEAGWLKANGNRISIPNFDYHLSQSAKTRAVAARKKKTQRQMSEKCPQKSGTKQGTESGPEKRREEKIDTASAVSVCDTKPKQPVSRGFVAPTVEEVRAYCIERANAVDPERFVDHYAARGWVMSNGRKIKDWQACVRTWEKNDAERRGHAGTVAIRPAAGGNGSGSGFATREQQREAANNAALAAFLYEAGVCEGDGGTDDAETNVGIHQAAAKRLVLRPEAIPGEDDQSVGRGASNVGDAISGGCRPIPPVSPEDAASLFPDGG